MKTAILTGIILINLLGVSGCTDREAEARKARADAEAKARADASKKEMDALPKTFQTPDYLKKNDSKPAVVSEPPKQKP
jgi:hypothetical protein